MGQKTGIQYCDDTVNPTSGCDGCELWSRDGEKICYAGHFHTDRLARALPQLYAKDFMEVRLCPGRVAKAAAWSDLTGKDRPDKPWLNGMPRVIFLSDMADALSKGVPFEYLKAEIIDNVTSAKGQRHIWMWLTKQSKRLIEFWRWLEAQGIKWPTNLWMGVSVTSRATCGRIKDLAQVGDETTTRWVSAEPLREAIDPDLTGIAMLITGGASKQDEGEPWPYDVHWAYYLLGKCERAGVAAFVKQLGARVRMTFARWQQDFLQHSDKHGFILDSGEGADTGTWSGWDSHGGDWDEWAEDLRRREYPSRPTPAPA